MRLRITIGIQIHDCECIESRSVEGAPGPPIQAHHELEKQLSEGAELCCGFTVSET